MPIPVPDLRALGVAVAQRRRELGWSIDRLAEASGIHRKTIIQIEAGRVSTKVSTLHSIAHALGMPLPDLVGVVCERHPKQVGVVEKLVEP